MTAGRLLAAAWLVVLAAVAGTVGWLVAAGEDAPPQPPALVLALPEPPPLEETPAVAAPAATPASPSSNPATDSASPDSANQSALNRTGPAQPRPASGEPPQDRPAAQAASGPPMPRGGDPSPAATPTSQTAPPAPAPPAQTAPAPPAPPSQQTPPSQIARLAPAATPRAADVAEPRKAWQANARAFTAPADRPRIALVITGLGIGQAVTRTAIDRLPPEVTLAFLPYVDNVADWVGQARAAGHEVLLNLPMEPAGYPKDDPGPRSLLTMLDSEQNLERLDWVLNRAKGYVGVMNVMGSRFLTSEEHLRPVLADLRDRGLLFVDSGATPRSVAVSLASDLRLSRAVSDRFVDSEVSRASIDRRLREVEQIARSTGAAVAVGRPYPVTLDAAAEWATGLAGRGFALAPISAVADRQVVK